MSNTHSHLVDYAKKVFGINEESSETTLKAVLEKADRIHSRRVYESGCAYLAEQLAEHYDRQAEATAERDAELEEEGRPA